MQGKIRHSGPIGRAFKDSNFSWIRYCTPQITFDPETGKYIRRTIRISEVDNCSYLVVDITITTLGFSGVEDVDWVNLESVMCFWYAQKPINLSATKYNDSRIDLVWTNVDAVGDGVKIERSTDGINFTQITTVALGVSSYSNIGLSATTKYYYRIRAYWEIQNSDYSDIVDATTDASYEAETTTLVARASVAPNKALTDLINLTIKGLKDDGVFALGDCLYVRGVHESTLASQNWIKNAHNSTLNGSPIFMRFLGFIGTAAAKYIDNNYILKRDADKAGLASITVLVYTRGADCPGYFVVGANDSVGETSWTSIRYYSTSTAERGYINSVLYNTAINIELPDVDNIWGYSRDAGNIAAYRNGSPVGATQAKAAAAEMPDITMIELGQNDNGTPTGTACGPLLFSFYGAKLTDAQHLALYNRIAYFYSHVIDTYTYDTNLIINGGFDADSDWTKSAQFTITGGKAVFDDTADGTIYPTAAVPVTAGKYYRVKFTISDCTGIAQIGLKNQAASWIMTEYPNLMKLANGSYDMVFLCAANGTNILIAADSDSASSWKLDNFSLQEML